eukprot:SAG31_NODE_33945_length_338_cov_1.075314_1_plen_92_part_01
MHSFRLGIVGFSILTLFLIGICDVWWPLRCLGGAAPSTAPSALLWAGLALALLLFGAVSAGAFCPRAFRPYFAPPSVAPYLIFFSSLLFSSL